MHSRLLGRLERSRLLGRLGRSRLPGRLRDEERSLLPGLEPPNEDTELKSEGSDVNSSSDMPEDDINAV